MTDKIAATTNGNSETKAQIVERILKSRAGASIADLMQATGWQPHSCRAYLTGLRKKGMIPLRDKRKDGTTFYQLASTAKAEPGSNEPSAANS